MSSRQVVKKIFANFENSNDGANIRQGITKWVSYFLSQFSKKNLVPSPSNFIYIFFSFWVNSGVTMSYWTRSCRLLNFLVILITLAMCNLKFVILIFFTYSLLFVSWSVSPPGGFRDHPHRGEIIFSFLWYIHTKGLHCFVMCLM